MFGCGSTTVISARPRESMRCRRSAVYMPTYPPPTIRMRTGCLSALIAGGYRRLGLLRVVVGRGVVGHPGRRVAADVEARLLVVGAQVVRLARGRIPGDVDAAAIRGEFALVV